eukprot:5385440-Amphidinium_carterae.2
MDGLDLLSLGPQTPRTLAVALRRARERDQVPSHLPPSWTLSSCDFALDNSVASDQALEQRLSELYEVTRLKRAQPYGSLSNPLTGACMTLDKRN